MEINNSPMILVIEISLFFPISPMWNIGNHYVIESDQLIDEKRSMR